MNLLAVDGDSNRRELKEPVSGVIARTVSELLKLGGTRVPADAFLIGARGGRSLLLKGAKIIRTLDMPTHGANESPLTLVFAEQSRSARPPLI
jgi:hypothetical protein